MAKILSFFPRQAVAGPGANLASEVFDVSDIAQIVAEFRAHSWVGSTSGVSAWLEDTPGPSLSPASWRTVYTGGISAAVSTGIAVSNLQRFLRARLVTPTIGIPFSGAIVSFEGVGRETT
jgi:hypothetical protein